ncbi:MAG TPA: transposase [Gemmataceae bacterium]|nr:transposase [Gemmataceae bacterium]
MVDGSSFSSPDTPELQQHLGRPTHQKPGCGFPVAHILALFHAGTVFLLRVLAAPLHTSDAVQAPATHEALAAGDVLVGDRMFASFVHLALLQQRRIQGVFRMHQRQIVNFRPHRRFSRGSGKKKGQPSSRWLRHLGHWDRVGIEGIRDIRGSL